jgi:thiosulfate/3-mercaptopyruvate sulfurtransferase
MPLILLALFAVSTASEPILVETTELVTRSGTFIVDARDRSAFVAGHIPGAAHLEVNALSDKQDGVVGLLKPRGELLTAFAASGLRPDDDIVVYTGLDDASDLILGTRLFWILEHSGFPRVRLLNGGLAKWKAEGRPTETGESAVRAAGAGALSELVPDGTRHASLDEVMATQKSQKGLIVDARGKSSFTGESDKSFIERDGHITGAINRPASGFVEGDFYTFKSRDRIRTLVDADNLAEDAPVVTYCNTGRSATISYVAYRIAGFTNVSMYDGSMAEWGNRAGCPVSRGVDE